MYDVCQCTFESTIQIKSTYLKMLGIRR